MNAVGGHGPIAYVMSRFPKLTETFVLQEIVALENDGVDVRLYPLLRERGRVVQLEAAALVKRATYLPFLSPAIARSNLAFLGRRPRAYLGALATLVRETVGSANYLLGGLAIFPKAVHMATLMERAGIVHVHCHFSNHPAAAGFVIHRLTGIPYSFTAHGSDLHVDRHMLRRKASEAAFVVAISEDNRRVIERECGPDVAARIEVIHCGVNTDEFAPSPATAAGTRGGPLTLATIGTLHEVKGQAHLIEACRLLAQAGTDFTCRIVGDGPDRPMLREMVARYGLGDRVRFEGALTSPRVRDLLRTTDVLVAPSVPTRSGRREGIPVVLMEAMACGVPVVASRLSGIPELVEHNETGLLVPPGDPHAIAAALTRLSRDRSLRDRLGRAGRERVVRDFNVRLNAARLARRFFDGRVRARARRAARRPTRGFTVALIGPDGAGKTTVGRRLVDELPFDASYLYMGVNPSSGNRVLPTTRLVHALRRRRSADGTVPVRRRAPDRRLDPAGTPGLLRSVAGAVRSLLRTANRFAEEWYRQAVAWVDVRRGRVVIFDRHFYSDYYATDVAARHPGLARRVHGLVLKHLYPKPDLVVYLDAPPAILLARKGEGTLESLDQMRSEYLDLGRTLRDFHVVDASASAETVTTAAGEAIVAFAARQAHRVPAASGAGVRR